MSNVMKLALLCSALLWSLASAHRDTFSEELFFKPLPNDHVYAYFQFTTLLPADSSLHHTRLFPRSLGEIIARYQIDELHLSLTEGLWRHSKWGYPIADAPPGAQLYAWFSAESQDVDGQWKRLADTLSGLFCASLNFIDASNSLNPRLSLRRSGVYKRNQHNNTFLRYSTLPREIVCTENLTPWKKLLPCDSKRGLATLLNSDRLHNTNYHSLGVHFRLVCGDDKCKTRSYELRQTVSLVYDSKVLNSRDWSVQKLFGQGLFGSCPLASTSSIYVDVTSNETNPFTLTPTPDFAETSFRGGVKTETVGYDIKARSSVFNVALVYRDAQKVSLHVPPPIHAHRHIAGYGQERSSVVTYIHNTHWQSIDVVFLENIPWFMPVYLQSLVVETERGKLKPNAKYYVPGKGKTRPYYLELALRLPPKSATKISIEFDYVFLKWQEYPPDANHGFYVGSAIVTALLPVPKNFTSSILYFDTLKTSMNVTRPGYIVQLHTESMIVTLPTPDFSMPYNVICLACTVVALAFGPLHNITTKSLQLIPEADDKNVFQNAFEKMKNKLFAKKNKNDAPKEETAESNEKNDDGD